MESSSVIEKAISKIKGGGFWSNATEIRIRCIIRFMIDSGIEDERSAKILTDIWQAASSEFCE